MKITRVIVAFLAAAPLIAGPVVFAVTAPAATIADPCTITPADLAAIKTAQANGLRDELTARRALLTRTITCAKEDAVTLANTLANLSVQGDAKGLQARLGGKLSDAASYYDIELSKVGDAGVLGTQAIAREVLTWRVSNYDPLAAQVGNFTLWAKNQPVFSAADSRLGQVRNIVRFLEQAAPNGDLESSFGAAEALVQTATNENRLAENAMLQGLPPDQTLDLIQQSLKSLSDAYAKFFDVSNMAQSLLSASPEEGNK